jgi:ATP-dependent Clp protease ATP-binding subunit ClpC
MTGEASSSKSVMELARGEAVRLGHEYVGTEHQLLGVLLANDADVARLIESHGITADDIRSALLDAIPAGNPGSVDPGVPLPVTNRAKRVLNFAEAESLATKPAVSYGLRLLQAFFLEDRNLAAMVLRRLGIQSV